MINNNELRIGNLIRTDYEGELIVQGVAPDHIQACRQIGLPTGYYSLPSINPIPLTEEWLLKLNFKKANGYFYSPFDPIDVTYEYEIEGLPFYGRFHFNIKHNNGYFSHHWCEGESNQEESVTRNVGYVHDLQNLFYSLSGEELTIK